MQSAAELSRRTAAVGTGSSPYATQVITKMPNWGILTAFDILLNNLAVGVFLAVMLGWLLAPSRFAPLVSPAVILALLLLGADLLLLVVDLGDTWRFHHMLRVFKPRAPMSLGTWSLTLFGILLGVAALVAVLRWLGAPPWLDWIGNTAAVLAVDPALGAILYKGVLFSVTSQPGWRDARWLGGYMSNSAILLGCSLLLALAAVLGAGRGAAATLRAALLGLLLLDILLFIPSTVQLRSLSSRDTVKTAGCFSGWAWRRWGGSCRSCSSAGGDCRNAAGGLLPPGRAGRADLVCAPAARRRSWRMIQVRY